MLKPIGGAVARLTAGANGLGESSLVSRPARTDWGSRRSSHGRRERIGGVVARLTAGARSVRNRDPRAADARPRRGPAIATRRRDDPTQAPHRHSDFPHGTGTGLLLRRQDRPYPAVARRHGAAGQSKSSSTVDKTGHIRRLLDEGTHYISFAPAGLRKEPVPRHLQGASGGKRSAVPPSGAGASSSRARPKELLEGNEALFHGLSIHERRDWSVRHPVVRLSFGSGHFQGPGDLRTEVMDRLEVVESDAAVKPRHVSAPARLTMKCPSCGSRKSAANHAT